MFPASTLAHMRAITEAEMDLTAVFQEPLDTEGPGGKVVHTWPIVASGVPCRLTPLSGSERLIAAQRELKSTHRLTIPAGQPIKPQWRVLITGVDAAGAVWTRTAEVTDIAAPRSNETQRTVYVVVNETVEA